MPPQLITGGILVGRNRTHRRATHEHRQTIFETSGKAGTTMAEDVLESGMDSTPRRSANGKRLRPADGHLFTGSRTHSAPRIQPRIGKPAIWSEKRECG